MAANTQVGVDLKKESEVREYLDNLGTEYRFGCYSQNDAKGIFQKLYILFLQIINF